MGCTNSKIENEEVVARCKARKRLMKQAVIARHAFALSHAHFVMSLRGVGSAFLQFAEGEVKDNEAGLFPPETPTTPSLSPPPLPMPPPPPPMSPAMSSPSPPPPLPPGLEHPRPRPQRTSPLARAASSPETFRTEESPPPPRMNAPRSYRMEDYPPPRTTAYRMDRPPPQSYRVVESPPARMMPKSYRMEESPPPPMIAPKSYRLDESAPPPPLVTPIQVEDDWRYNQAPPPPPPPQEGQPPPPPMARSSWQDLFLDPFRPPPPSFNYMELRRNQEKAQESERERERAQEQERAQERERAIERERAMERERVLERERAQAKMVETAPEYKPVLQYEDKKLMPLEEDDIPDLEDIDENIDGVPLKDSDDEEEVKAIKVVEKAPKATKVEKTEQQEKSVAKANKELAVVIPEKRGRDLLDVLKEVDECFLKAAESGENVSRMLETRKVHYHSSFSDSLRGVGESARMHLHANFWKKSGSPGSQLRISSNMSTLSDETASITSVRSLSSLSSARWTEDYGMTGSHASTLDRLLAWEKKLYLEVKEAEALRIELEKKYSVYRHQDNKGEDHTVMDKTRGTIKMLQTRMVVAIQAVDSAATAVQKLRDEELYPQLLDLLEGMGNMWKEMAACHQTQLKAVEAMKRLDNSAAFEPTTSSHRHDTFQLELALNKWAESVSRVVISQRDYLKNLSGWLRLSLMQFGTEEMERNGLRSPSRSPRSPFASVGASPIYALCQQWQASLDQLPDTVVLEAIHSFAAVVREMLRLQWEELRIKKKVEQYYRELQKREHSLLSASMRDPPSMMPPPMPRSPTTTSGSDDNEERFDIIIRDSYPERSEVTDRRMRMEAARRKLEDEQEVERKAYTDTRAYTLNSLQAGLPQMFQAVIKFSNEKGDIYERLNSMGAISKLAPITDN